MRRSERIFQARRRRTDVLPAGRDGRDGGELEAVTPLMCMGRCIGPFMIPIFVLGLAGCSTKVSLEFNCRPAGATLFETAGGVFGCPSVVQYEVPKTVGAEQRFPVSELAAVWPSGARTTVRPLLMGQRGSTQSLTIQRPADAPGLDEDLENARRVQDRLNARRAEEAALQARNDCISMAMGLGGLAGLAARNSRTTSLRVATSAVDACQ
jgi:hypothetical protein